LKGFSSQRRFCLRRFGQLEMKLQRRGKYVIHITSFRIRGAINSDHQMVTVGQDLRRTKTIEQA
jgi:hypothetical protein